METSQNINCPIWQSPSDRIFRKDGYWILGYKNCHHRYIDSPTFVDHINQVYSDEYFNGAPAGYPDYLEEAQILISHGVKYGSILNKYTSPGTLLDVGTAAGFILKGLLESGWHGVGLEPNSTMADYGRNHLDLQIETGCLEQFSSSRLFDLVSMVQVIAHFNDIRKALQNAADATKSGGYWLIETWDRESWIARCVGRHWHEYSPPSVLHWFSRAGLNMLVSQFGFREVAQGRISKFLNGAHAKSIVGHNLKNIRLDWLRRVLNNVPDHLVIPYPSFDLFWILFQKSMNSDV